MYPVQFFLYKQSLDKILGALPPDDPKAHYLSAQSHPSLLQELIDGNFSSPLLPDLQHRDLSRCVTMYQCLTCTRRNLCASAHCTSIFLYTSVLHVLVSVLHVLVSYMYQTKSICQCTRALLCKSVLYIQNRSCFTLNLCY